MENHVLTSRTVLNSSVYKKIVAWNVHSPKVLNFVQKILAIIFNNYYLFFTAKCQLEKNDYPPNTLKYFSPSTGNCTNTRFVRGLAKCVGSCESGTTYNSDFELQSYCKCCQFTKSKKFMVDLECDGSIGRVTEQIEVPLECKCNACGSEGIVTSTPKLTSRRGTPTPVARDYLAELDNIPEA